MSVSWGIRTSVWREVVQVASESRARSLIEMLTTSAVSPPFTELMANNGDGWRLIETVYAVRRTPVTSEGLDRLAPEHAIASAWMRPSDTDPNWHEHEQRRKAVREAMPTLARALDRLTADRGWTS